MPTILLHFWPYIAMAVMGLGIWGLFEEHKADALKHANDQAVIQQDLKDRATSAAQIATLETKLGALDVKVQPIIQRIVTAPITNGCGPSVGFSIDGVRDLFSASSPAPGPKPPLATGLPTPISPRGKSQ